MEFPDIIAALGRAVGIDIAIEDDACRLEVDDTPLTIRCIPELRKICISAEIAEPPPERLGPLFQTLLRANHLFQGTAGATLSLDPETDVVCLCRCEQLDALDEARFLSLMTEFVNTMETWAGLVVDYRPTDDSPSVDGAAATDDGSRGLDRFGFIQV